MVKTKKNFKEVLHRTKKTLTFAVAIEKTRWN